MSRLKPTLSPADKVIEAISWILHIGLWIFVLEIYSSLPEIIPTHFNASGIADAHGSKSTIMILPIVVSAIFLLLTVLQFFPQAYNYAVAITPENIERQQQNATRLIRSLKCILMVVFLTIVFYTSKTVTDASAASWGWLFPVVIVSVFGCIGYYMYRSIKMR